MTGLAPTERDPGPVTPAGRVLAALRRVPMTAWVTGLLVGLATAFVVWVVNPEGLLFRGSTPTGGDLGAHVWGPAFIRDELLPRFRLTGWTPDWYAGFPAYHFYMVVPMLFIVAVNIGLVMPLAVPVVIAAVAGIVNLARRRPTGWAPLVWVLLIAAVLAWPVQYGVAIKFVTVAGLVLMPIAGWTMGRLAGLPFPAPAVLGVSTLAFIVDRSFNIFGGNLMSTMAGEFAYVLAVSACLVYIGLLMRGLDTGEGRAWAAVALAATGLCHLLVAFFALLATAVAFAIGPSRARLRWIVTSGAVSGLLAAFWVLRFWWQRDHLNDMAWDKLPRFRSYLWDRSELAADFLTNDPPFQVVAVLAVVGTVMSLVFRRRLGLVLAGSMLVMGLAFIHLPEGRLYNGRILPAYYLCGYLLAALAVAEFLRLAGRLVDGLQAGRWRPAGSAVTAAGAVVAAVALIVSVGLPMRALPGGRLDGNTYRWMGLSSTEFNLGRAWVNWNFTGYEGRTGDTTGGGWDEHRAFVATMETVAAEHGCGRLLWEYNRDLVRYGTPMALMLIPHWTDGCVGSMEGLYFEASTTTPYHFMMQSELSVSPSRAQRNLPYRSFDLDSGVDHLQQVGVAYYAAFSERPGREARDHPSLTEVAVSGPWTVFLVEDAPVVEALDVEPAVWSDVDHESWLEPAAALFDEGSTGVVHTVDGPVGWQRLAVDEPAEVRPLPPVTVTDIDVGVDRVSFRVDRVGVPVMVKVSYFPNWEVDGADGPWRATPNLMVVVPTEETVTLTYGRTGIDLFALVLTLVGVVALVILWRRPEPTGEPDGDAGDAAGSAADRALDRWVDGRSGRRPPDDAQPENGRPDTSVSGDDTP